MGNVQSAPSILHTTLQFIFDFYHLNLMKETKIFMEKVNKDNDDPVPEQKFSNFDQVDPIVSMNGKWIGYKPKDASSTKKYPLHIWIQGFKDPHKFDDKINTNYMANKGFVSISLEYDWTHIPFFCDILQAKAKKLFDDDDSKRNPSKLVQLCNLEEVDCSQGIVISGFSSGADLALLASNYIKKWEVKGVLAMNTGYHRKMSLGLHSEFNCLKHDSLNIDTTRIRAVTSEKDTWYSATTTVQDQMEVITGCKDNYDGISCKDEFDCIQENDGGYGWCIVQHSDIADAFGFGIIHNWRGRNDYQPDTLDAKYYNGTFCGAFKPTHDWLAQQIST